MTEVAKSYGGALFELCLEDGCEKQVLDELCFVDRLMGENPEWLKLLSAPIIKKEERLEMLDGALKNAVHPYVLNFLKILCTHGYIGQYENCRKEFLNRYYEVNNIAVAKVESAVELSQEQQARLSKKLSEATNKNIILQCAVEPSLLGGLRITVNDKQLDGTVKHRLEKIKSNIAQNVLG